MADFCIEKKIAAAPGKDWVPAFGMTKMSLPVARTEADAIKIFNTTTRNLPVARLVTWDGSKKRVIATKGIGI